MHILFTRPLEDSKEIIIRFRNLGHKISHLPLLKIKKKIMIKLIFLIIRQLSLQVRIP